MNANDRDELARLLPGPVERDLPGDRHHQLQEFVMSEIQRDPAPRRPVMRRSVLVTSALTAVAAVAATIGIAVTGQSGDGPAPPGPAAMSGREILLAAANTAQRQPEATGKYWHVRIVSRDAANNLKNEVETWVDRDGVNWIRFPGGMPDPNDTTKRIYHPIKWGERGFSLVGPHLTFAELQNLPTTPDALKASITAFLSNRNGGSEVDPTDVEERVLYGLVALVSQLPAPPKVRAAAFQAIAAYRDVVNVGPVEGGQALRFPVFAGGFEARLVIDPVAAQVRETNLTVAGDSVSIAHDGSMSMITSEWTDTLPT